MLHFASPERQDSLVNVIAVMAAPPGSDLNPMRLEAGMQLPSLPLTGGLVGDTLESRTSQQDMVLALSAVVTREGRVSGLSVLSNDHERQNVTELLKAISEGRLEPAQLAGAPVAVNLVWLVAHTTVRGKIS